MVVPRKWAIIGYPSLTAVCLFTSGFDSWLLGDMVAILDLVLASANQRAAFHSLHLFTSWLTAIGRHQHPELVTVSYVMS